MCSFCQQIIPKFDDKKTNAEFESSVLIHIIKDIKHIVTVQKRDAVLLKRHVELSKL